MLVNPYPNLAPYSSNIKEIRRFRESPILNEHAHQAIFRSSKKFHSENINVLYIILKFVIWRFQLYNLFREILKLII